MEAIKKYKKQLFFHLFLNFVFGVFITFSSYYHLPLNDFKDHLYYFFHFLILQFSIFGYLYLLSINRLIFVSVFPIIFVLLSIASFWIYTQDIAISQSIIQASIESKPDVIFDLLSIPFLVFMLVSIIFVFIILKMHRIIKINQIKSPLLLLAIISILSYSFVEDYRFGTLRRRLPYNVVIATNEYYSQNKITFKTIKNKLKTGVDSLNIVFILGESVRADHLQLNGYYRQTNPLLSKRKNIVSFSNAYTPLTYTAISVPQILTNASLTDNYSEPKYSLIDVLNYANIKTSWIGNQTSEKSFGIFINQSTIHKLLDPMHSESSFRKDYDEKLIPVFKSIYKPFENQFTTIHMMGSHWWYETRYPESFRYYRPIIKSKYVPSNTKEEMINSYDNTILYLDYFIDEVIKNVEKTNSNTLVIYLSDHGELLGENNLWLHAQNGKESENPAMIIWYSDIFEKEHSKMIENLKLNNSKKTDLDFFFPSIIDLYKIEGIKYNKSKVFYK